MKKARPLMISPLLLILTVISTSFIFAQSNADYTVDSEWAQLPSGTNWDGSTSWITADGLGNIIVLVRNKPYFRMFTRGGELVKTWNAEVDIASAHSVTIDQDNYYWVTDSAGHVVRKFDNEGNLLMTLGSKGEPGDNNSTSLFNQPNHVAITASGEIYVSDGYVNSRVVQFTSDGEFIRMIGGKLGSGDGELRAPHGVALDSEENIWVNDSENFRVVIFDRNGNFVENLPYPSRGGIEMRAGDTVYISDVNEGVINVLKEGELQATYYAPRAHGLGVDTDGSIYASGASRMTVMKIIETK